MPIWGGDSGGKRRKILPDDAIGPDCNGSVRSGEDVDYEQVTPIFIDVEEAEALLIFVGDVLKYGDGWPGGVSLLFRIQVTGRKEVSRVFEAKWTGWLCMLMVFALVLSWYPPAVDAAARECMNKQSPVKAIFADNLIGKAAKKADKSSAVRPNCPCRSETIKWDLTPEEMKLFAQLVHAEANGEPYSGMVAVAATVLNRIHDKNYPDDLKGVIFQLESGHYQYSPVRDGRIWQEAEQPALRAIKDALKGEDPSGGATSFYNPRKTDDRWVRRQPVTNVIGNHVFFKSR
jgi:spore germination cell wall hydrolase CwlJ-like protein